MITAIGIVLMTIGAMLQLGIVTSHLPWRSQRSRSLDRWPRAAQRALLICLLISLAGSLLLLLGIALA